MKKLLLLLFLTLSAHSYSSGPPNILLIDSSFAPVILTHGGPTPDQCLLISENNSNLSKIGDCYNKKEWTSTSKKEVSLLKGLQDILAGIKNTPTALKWIRYNNSNPKKAKSLKNKYLIAAHGSRSAFILDKFGGQDAKILYMRNMTTGIGRSKLLHKVKTPYPRYQNNCGLTKWPESELKKFNIDSLLPYQKIISDTLSRTTSLKIVNLSLGYKKSWITEDNPRCTDDQVSGEFDILVKSWNNLIVRHPQVLFIVASGNENENFDNPRFQSNDLWARLASQGTSNLLLVGSTYENGMKLPSSNYGKVVEAMALGNNILINSPTPENLNGYQTTVRGTSFTTPYISAAATKLFKKTGSVYEIKSKLVGLFFRDRKEKIKNNFLQACSKTQNLKCLQAIITILSGPFLWGDTHTLFSLGKQRLNFAPFQIEYKKNLGAQAKVQLVKYKDQFLPTLFLGDADGPYDLLLTLHHEMHHYSQMAETMKYFWDSAKINNCTTKYRIEMLKDEPRAFKKELEFYESSPQWFRKGADSVKFNSRLLNLKNITYSRYYKDLRKELNKNKDFIIERYIQMGEYDPCTRLLLLK